MLDHFTLPGALTPSICTIPGARIIVIRATTASGNVALSHPTQRLERYRAAHTIAPDGTIWTGRNWNQPPASAAGHNGNRTAGPFMFEMIGDFDHGHDRFEGEQRRGPWGHFWYSKIPSGTGNAAIPQSDVTKACPGNSLDYQKIVAAVQALQASGEFAAAFGTRDVSDGPFGSDVVASRTVIESVSRPLPVRDDPADAEPDDDDERCTGACPVRGRLYRSGGTRRPSRWGQGHSVATRASSTTCVRMSSILQQAVLHGRTIYDHAGRC